MFSSLALETMNSVSPELTWKPFTKGRRSRKSVARSFGSPKRLVDTLGSCSDKVDGSVRGHSTSHRKEKVPIKKRRRLDRLSSSMKLDSPTALSDEDEQPLYPSYSSEDLSGIELLAAVASMDDDFMNAGLEDLPESSLAPRCSDAATFTSQSKELPKPNELDTSLCDKTLLGVNSGCAHVLPESAASSETLCTSTNENNIHKVNRKHWDLNILMDAWVEPCDSNLNGMPLEEKRKDSEDQLLPNLIGKTDECPHPGTEGSESAVGPDSICYQSPYRKEHEYSSFAKECPDQITRNDVDERNANQVLGCDSCLETSKQVKMTEAAIDRSLVHKLLMQEEQFVKLTGTTAELQDEVFSSKMILCAETLAFDRAHTRAQDIALCDLPTIEVSESMIGVQCNDSKDSVMGSGRPHATISVENVTPCTSRSHSEENENNSKEAKLTLFQKQVDNRNDGVREIIMPGSRAQIVDPSVLFENNDLAVPDVSHCDQGHMVGDDVTRHEEKYDSSYEDGELRGSFLYSWEDNALENESVDYESDGRNVDGPSADDHAGYEILEGGSEGSHGSETRNLKENESVARSLRHFVNDDPDHNEVSGKGESNAGSGTTVENSLELIIEENDGCMKRQQLSDRRDLFVGKSREADGYPLKFAARQSFIDSLDRRNPYSIQRCRSYRYGGSFSRTAREVTPERYQGRRKPISYNERDGVDQWTHWASKKRFTSRYQGAEGRGYTRPRTNISNSSEFNRLDDDDHRKTANSMSISFHKPFVRKSPLDKDDSLGIRRRTPLGQGTSTYKSRVYYSERAGRDFGEHLEPPPEHDATRVTRLTRYSSRREHSFSPNPGAVARFNTRRRRSRSRSRTPPRVWQSHRDRSLYTMKHSRSQDFGCEVRTGRVRIPFHKSAFASEYEDNYSSPSRRRFSPIRRWVDDHGPIGADYNIRHRRSPVRYLRRTRKFNTMGSGGVKDEHYPVRRFYFKPNSGREAKLESSSDYGCDDNGEGKLRGNVRRIRTDAAGDFETSGLNNDNDKDADGVLQAYNPCDLPLVRTEKGDETCLKSG